VRLALEENHMLPGDPNRVFNSFLESGSATRATPTIELTEHEAPAHDPTTLKPQETNPFTGSE
jgi:small conductance mechanosensitive channel